MLKVQPNPTAWTKARLYFDGGARGNPGPGGSGWALATENERGQWYLRACGYEYHGADATNNQYEFEALRTGLARGAQLLLGYAIHLKVYGNSNILISQQLSYSTTRAAHLQSLVSLILELRRPYQWISWHHIVRMYNKTTDCMANLAMDSTSSRVIDSEQIHPLDATHFDQAVQLLTSDTAFVGDEYHRPVSILSRLQQYKAS